MDISRKIIKFWDVKNFFGLSLPFSNFKQSSQQDTLDFLTVLANIFLFNVNCHPITMDLEPGSVLRRGTYSLLVNNCINVGNIGNGHEFLGGRIMECIIRMEDEGRGKVWLLNRMVLFFIKTIMKVMSSYLTITLPCIIYPINNLPLSQTATGTSLAH